METPTLNGYIGLLWFSKEYSRENGNMLYHTFWLLAGNMGMLYIGII